MKHWIFNSELGYRQCPYCKRWIHVLQGDAVMNYCPNCGERLLDGEVIQHKQNTTTD